MRVHKKFQGGQSDIDVFDVNCWQQFSKTSQFAANERRSLYTQPNIHHFNGRCAIFSSLPSGGGVFNLKTLQKWLIL